MGTLGAGSGTIHLFPDFLFSHICPRSVTDTHPLFFLSHFAAFTPRSLSSQAGDAGDTSGESPDGLSPEIIDMDIFGQLLEMDDEEDREFSKSIVWNYFDQAETTFEKMDQAL